MLDGRAFAYTSISSIAIPRSVTNVENDMSQWYQPFKYCSNLSEIIVSQGNSIYDSRDYCNAIIHTATNTIVSGSSNTTIP